MPKTQSYNDMTVELMQSTPYPTVMTGLALNITMHASNDKEFPPASSNIIKFLIEAEHTSILEHVVYTFLIGGVSRSFLAQITRQRMASPTSGSQHYQDYRDYPCTVHPALVNNTAMQDILDESVEGYIDLVDNEEIPPEEARQVLPNAACVNYLWTINARSLLTFLRARCCNRNVAEMRTFANKVLSLVGEHFPELFSHVGPQCFMDGRCKQGRMQCKAKVWVKI